MARLKARVKASPRKGKGKDLRSHLTLDQHKDPEWKFPTSQGVGKGKAHLVVIADEGHSIPAKTDSAAAFVERAKSSAAAPKPIAAPAREPREMVMEGGDFTWVIIGMKPILRLPRR